MVRVEAAHKREIGLRGRAQQIGDATSAEAEPLYLTADAQSVVTLNHRLARANRPALPSAADKNPSLTSARQSSHKSLHIHRRYRLGLGGVAEHTGSATQQLPAPLGDLVGVYVKLPGSLGQRPLALDAGLGFRRGRLATISPRSRLSGRSHTKTPLNSPVQVSRATSVDPPPLHRDCPHHCRQKENHYPDRQRKNHQTRHRRKAHRHHSEMCLPRCLPQAYRHRCPHTGSPRFPSLHKDDRHRCHQKKNLSSPWLPKSESFPCSPEPWLSSPSSPKILSASPLPLK